MKRFIEVLKRIRRTPEPKQISRKELEEKAVEGAKKAVKEYRRVFERLSQYDRA